MSALVDHTIHMIKSSGTSGRFVRQPSGCSFGDVRTRQNPPGKWDKIRITGVTYENFRIPSQAICGRPRDPAETFRMNFWTPVTYEIFSIARRKRSRMGSEPSEGPEQSRMHSEYAPMSPKTARRHVGI
ncbi:hypothetical protein GGX14DRAFT_394420 [Mycena pura]|uniref:Uncharacterized protein n=1 Tax=Mycena pura TaxID=153505 RepID=A0AAD6VF29_9AGAR|nr:hypothetical protein GGX14DRAFT_394420 [Mycena pura]